MALNMSSIRDTKWLTLEVRRQFQRGTCSRSDEECKFAHPPKSCQVENGRVIACFDSLKVRDLTHYFCTRMKLTKHNTNRAIIYQPLELYHFKTRPMLLLLWSVFWLVKAALGSKCSTCSVELHHIYSVSSTAFLTNGHSCSSLQRLPT